MDKKLIGVVAFFLGVLVFLQSFNLQGGNKTVYLIVGIALVLWGVYYAAKK